MEKLHFLLKKAFLLSLLLLLAGAGVNAQTLPCPTTSQYDAMMAHQTYSADAGWLSSSYAPANPMVGQTVTLTYVIHNSFYRFSAFSINGASSSYGAIPATFTETARFVSKDNFGGSLLFGGFTIYDYVIKATITAQPGTNTYRLWLLPTSSSIWGITLISCATPISITAVSASVGIVSSCGILITNGPSCQLTAMYTGTTAQSYQWYEDGVPIQGATGINYTPSTAYAGVVNYTVAVTETSGAILTSPPKAITVADQSLIIKGNNVYYAVGTAATALTAVYAGPYTISRYQWYANGVAIAGATGANYTPSTVSAGVTIYTVNAYRLGSWGAGIFVATASNSVTVTVVTGSLDTAPTLTVSGATCNGGDYEVTFSSSGAVTVNAGTVVGNMVKNIPVGTDVIVTATNGNSIAEITVPSPFTCGTRSCTPPSLSAGQGVCDGTGTYSVAFSVSGGAFVSSDVGIVAGNAVTGIPIGTNVVITAESGTCYSDIGVNSPADCNSPCATAGASFSAAICNGATYTVNYVKTANTTLAASAGIVGASSITNIPSGVDVTITATVAGCLPQVVVISPPSTCRMVKVKAKAILQGAYTPPRPFSTTVMNTTLNTNGLLPLSQPYNTAPYNYAGTEAVSATFFAASANIVDWVLIQLRDAATPSNIVATRAAFILNTGDIVDTDGFSPVSFATSASVVSGNSYFIAIQHRNHLAIRSATAKTVSAISTTFYDFTTGQAQAYQDPAIIGNATMAATSSVSFAMWGGNGNSDTRVRASGPTNINDYIYLVNTGLGGDNTAIINAIYSNADYNMDGVIRTSGPTNINDYIFLINTVLNGDNTIIFTQHL